MTPHQTLSTHARCMRLLSLALTIIATCTLIPRVHAVSKLLGCFQDRFAASERDLAGQLILDETRMTPSYCERQCGLKQYKYFGLQYGAECWCGNSYGKHGMQPAGHCLKACSGDSSLKCGGELTNSVYEIITTYPPPTPHPDGRPLIGLVMIVKNESHTLPATLLAVKPWIDVYYILDTGSTDGTQDAIRRTLGADKGEVWEEPFIDYGRSRNRALEIAQTTKTLGGPPVFSLMLSADETINNGEGLRKFCEEHRDLSGPAEEAYYMTMDVGWRFDSARLSRTDKGWRYMGRVHEYLAPPPGNPRSSPSLRVPSTWIKFKVTDPERRGQREFIILKILQEEVAEKPTDTRSSFYLARTYNVVGNHSAALAEFQRRVSLGGWKEEVYESLYAIAWQKDSLGRPWHEVQQAFMDAHQHSPERAEPLYAIASHYYRAKQCSLAYMYASFAAQLPYPTSASLWVQADVYSWQCWMIMGMCGLDVSGRETEGARALIRALLKRFADKNMQQQAVKYRARIGTAAWEEMECELDPTHCKQKQARRGQDPPLDVLHSDGAAAAAHSAKPAAVHMPQVALHPPEEADGGDAGSVTHDGSRGLLYVLVAFLSISNVVLLTMLRKGGKGASSAAACMPAAISHAMGMHGSDKDV